MLNYDGESYYINGAEDWCVYAGGTSSELMAVADEIAEELSFVLTPESFSGDIESDKTAVADVAYVFAGELLTMADEGRFAETIYNPDGITSTNRHCKATTDNIAQYIIKYNIRFICFINSKLFHFFKSCYNPSACATYAWSRTSCFHAKCISISRKNNIIFRYII